MRTSRERSGFFSRAIIINGFVDEAEAGDVNALN